VYEKAKKKAMEDGWGKKREASHHKNMKPEARPREHRNGYR
jgi:hypothetical protein